MLVSLRRESTPGRCMLWHFGKSPSPKQGSITSSGAEALTASETVRGEIRNRRQQATNSTHRPWKFWTTLHQHDTQSGWHRSWHARTRAKQGRLAARAAEHPQPGAGSPAGSRQRPGTRVGWARCPRADAKASPRSHRSVTGGRSPARWAPSSSPPTRGLVPGPGALLTAARATQNC